MACLTYEFCLRRQNKIQFVIASTKAIIAADTITFVIGAAALKPLLSLPQKPPLLLVIAATKVIVVYATKANVVVAAATNTFIVGAAVL